jgi:predicted metal-dependent hydrolase
MSEMKKKLMEYLIHRVSELWEWKWLPKYTSIKVTKSERRWWSCTSKNWLCFSYRLAEYLEFPPILSSRGTRDLLQSETEADSFYRQNDKTRFIDAVIVHELAHLREKHHQPSFWKLVYTMMPEYETIMKDQKNLD